MKTAKTVCQPNLRIRLLRSPLLRFSEYYGANKISDKLFRKSKEGKIFKKLFYLVCNTRNIRLAYRNIKRNRGSKTPGTSNETVLNVEKMSIKQVVNLIKSRLKHFVPGAVRRVYIPKPDGRLRPLGIPNFSDRIVQQAIKQVIEPICEAKFHNHSYGFRSLRSTKHAIARALQLINLGNHMVHVVKLDIKSFFDKVNHKKLMQQIWSMGIRDKHILSIIKIMLKAPIKGEGVPTMGTPQGGILSPLLANICLNEFDWWLSNQWETFEWRKAYKGHGSRLRAMKKTNLKMFFHVRYADDVKIFCKDRKTAIKMLHAAKKWLKQNLKLEICEEKSGVIDLRKKSNDFLGLSFRAVRIRNKYVCITHVKDKALNKMQTDIKKQIVKIGKHPTVRNLIRYNAMVRGYHNYYNVATSCYMDFKRLAWNLRRTTYNRLKKFAIKDDKNSQSAILTRKKYLTTSQLTTIGDVTLIPIHCVRFKIPRGFTQSNTPYSEEGRVRIFKQLNAILAVPLAKITESPIMDETIEYNDNRISRWISQQGRCYVTDEFLNESFECHHVVPRKLGGSDRFDNLVILTPEVHRMVHMTNVEIIVEMLKYYGIKGDKLKKFNKLREGARLGQITF